jgi:hypothetical protein
MHYYTCQFCKLDNVAELRSSQFMSRGRRFGWDYFECHKCHVKYVISAGESEFGFAIKTNEPYKKFMIRAYIEACKRMDQDKPRVAEKKEPDGFDRALDMIAEQNKKDKNEGLKNED